MNFNKKKLMLVVGVVVITAFIGIKRWGIWQSPALLPAPVPEHLEYLPKVSHTAEAKQPAAISPAAAVSGKQGTLQSDFETETVGAPPQAFIPVVGNWVIGQDGGKKVLVVDGRAWSRGQTAAGIADRARSLYGERYAEFLDNIQSFAYFPYALASGVEDFRQGEITLRFKGIDGRIDQAAGILFNVKPNGDYLTLRANPLENNLVLWKFERGKRSSVKWVKNVSTPSKQWHELKLILSAVRVEGYINGKLYLDHTLPEGVSGRVGVWSKADSVVYFDDYKVNPEPKGQH